MGLRTLTPEESLRALEFGRKNYRPTEIVQQKERIETATVLLETKVAKYGITAEDETVIQSIVDMKLELDNLYMKWVTGEIEDKPHIYTNT